MTGLLPPLPAECVLDTNTVLALWLFEDPTIAGLRVGVEAGVLKPLCIDATLEELRRVLAYPRFQLSPERQQQIAGSYRARCRGIAIVDGDAGSLPICRDPDDQKFLELAAAAGAPLLISRDKALLRLARHRLLRDRLRILRPEAVEQALRQQAAIG
ncbi:MAG: putative toxin-antitoxin system toxin component, PIN family [Zoogloeaceae bacterium]|nr:putative toxin-antitoxin system toxin component, PIN family [Rhodocyclaceae bacterium]MCP5236813.1 putative toxin-antitoxin system toxin component, PIN family [Zoogloeaceae bacterium]